MRAARYRIKVRMLPSTTWEEANSLFMNWLRQRVRWIKGFMQTTLVYTRHPVQMFKNFGFKQYGAFLLFVGSAPLTLLTNLILWALFLNYTFFHYGPDLLFTDPWVRWPATVSFVFGNTVMVLLAVWGGLEEGIQGFPVVGVIDADLLVVALHRELLGVGGTADEASLLVPDEARACRSDRRCARTATGLGVVMSISVTELIERNARGQSPGMRQPSLRLLLNPESLRGQLLLC